MYVCMYVLLLRDNHQHDQRHVKQCDGDMHQGSGPSLVQLKACRLRSTKPLPEPMLI